MKSLIALLLPLLLVSCAHKKHDQHLKKASLTEQNLTIGKSLNSNRYSNIYFSAQPSQKDIKELKKQGFTHIINLRYSSEYNEKQERELAKKLNINYTQVPFDPEKDKFNDKFISEVTMNVMKHRKSGKTLIHCSSGNRTALWVGGHFFKDHKYSKEDSIKTAKKMGLTKVGFTKYLNEYFKTK